MQFSSYQLSLAAFTGINILLAYSAYATLMTGQLSLGNAGFMAVGAYTAAVLTVKFGVPIGFAVVAACWVSALLGVLIGFPVLRLRGIYLAIATLAFGELVRAGFLNVDFFGGARGFRGMTQVSEGLIWVWVIGAMAIFALISRSRLGLAMRAVRDDELAAEVMGVPTTWMKIAAFGIGSSLAGAAGALYAHYALFIEPPAFGFLESITIAMFVLLGGFRSTWGPIVGAVLWVGLPEVLRPLQEWRGAFFGALLVLLLIVRPFGLIGGVGRKRDNAPVG